MAAPTKCTRCNAPLGDGAKFCLQCGALVEMEAEEGQDRLVGKIIADRYRVNKVLGEGGMGIVYLAEQKMGAATRKVAIKTLHTELGGDPQLVARFYRECETVIELSHPNTIQFYDFGKLDDGTLYIVMEFIQGGSLAAELQKGAMDPPRADRILVQVCGSLHEAHQRGIVHRDLKPENVLLTNRGGQTDFVKVLDFGIAKRSEAEDDKKGKLTQQGMVLGTPPYMSPEQFGGQTLDARSDIYSLGIMTYEMLTGRLPFEAKTPWEWATKHLTAPPMPFETYPEIAARIQPQKKAAVMRALAKNRDQRQATVLEFLQELTGGRDAQHDWTVASQGGAIVPKDAPARIPAPTPGPMPQATPGLGMPQATPGLGMPQATPGYGMMATQQATPLPGQMTPLPGHMTPPPGLAPPPGYGGQGYSSQPGFPQQQQQSYPGYTTGPMQQRSGGGLGKILVLAVILLFIVGGGVVGGILFFAEESGPTTATNGPGGTTPPVIPTVPTNPTVPTPPTYPTNPTVPTTPTYPTNPTNPMVPTTPTGLTPTGLTPVNPVSPPVDPPDHDDTPHGGGGPSAADEATARNLVSQGLAAVDRDDVSSAVDALGNAQRSVGRHSALLNGLRSALEHKGSNKVGILMQQGDCNGAQSLFRQLRSVGADGASRQHFSDDWCPRP